MYLLGIRAYEILAIYYNCFTPISFKGYRYIIGDTDESNQSFHSFWNTKELVFFCLFCCYQQQDLKTEFIFSVPEKNNIKEFPVPRNVSCLFFYLILMVTRSHRTLNQYLVTIWIAWSASFFQDFKNSYVESIFLVCFLFSVS